MEITMSDTIAIQGVQASFHDIAAHRYFGAANSRVYCDTFSDTFAALTSGSADYALCAIENSLYGSINEVYDLLVAHDFHIIGEVYLRIEQCLIGLPDAKIDDITEVHSHPVALAQCERYLDEQLPTTVRMEYHDTAASVEMVATLQDPTVAAIASRQAAELYGMRILAESIETDPQNYTRFVALSKRQNDSTSVNKTSLVLKTDNSAGALYRALGCFAKRGINLTKLQSRPVMGDAWKYIFYIDVAIGTSDPDYIAAFSELQAQKCTVTTLGSYQSGSDS
jgi:prephenate dehydratase